MSSEYTNKTQQLILKGLEGLVRNRAIKSTDRIAEFSKSQGNPFFATEYERILQVEICKETELLIQYLNKMMDGYFQTY